MSEYKISPYQPGIEETLLEISKEVAKNWVWPFHFGLQTFKDLHKKTETHILFTCYKKDVCVGYVFARVGIPAGVIGPSIVKDGSKGASLFPPRVLPGHEECVDLLMEKIIHELKNKGIKFILMRASTMATGSIQLAEKFGFSQHPDFPLGYKLYYHYDLTKGKINEPTTLVDNFSEDRDMEECIPSVANFFKLSNEEAQQWILEVNSREDLVSHLVIREDNKLVAYCFAFPNFLKKEIIATYHFETKNEVFLKQLLIKTIDNAIEKNAEYFLVDVIADLLNYEKVFQSLGFEKVASWGFYEKSLVD